MVCLGVLAGGCRAERNPLEPSPRERQVAGSGDAIETEVAGVHVRAASDAWPGRRSVLDDVTPLRLAIYNDSNEPIALHLEQIRLTDEAGREYAALPLFLIDGEARIVEDQGYRPNPAFSYDGYYVADPYDRYYRDMNGWRVRRPHAAPYQYRSDYYETYYRYWEEIDLPTPMMADYMIPEGVVDVGGYVDGFVYFERVDPLTQSVQFELDLVDAEDGTELGTADLHFQVVP